MGNIGSRLKSTGQTRSHRIRTRASFPSQALDLDSGLVSGIFEPPHQAEELEICSDDIQSSTPECRRPVLLCGVLGLVEPRSDDIQSSTPECRRPVLLCGGLGLVEPPEVAQWQRYIEIYLTENQLIELPENPRCPDLLVLYLNRNRMLRDISPSFFDYMPAIETLNLSRTGIKTLPESLFRLSRLKRLFLTHCHQLFVLPPQIGQLQQLEVLDLEGSMIMDLPKEVTKLTKLTCLRVTFCRCIYRKVHTLFPEGTISALSQLEELSIEVSPEDERWRREVEAVVDDVCGLTRLDTLNLYFLHEKLLRKFVPKVSRSLLYFKLIVGDHDESSMNSLPVDLEFELEYWDRSLRYVCGVGVPIDIKKLLKHSTAFYLDRCMDVSKLSDFGIENMEQLKCCIIGECKEMQVVLDGTDMDSEADRSETVLETREDDRRFLGSLEYLYIARMKSLRHFYEGSPHRGCLSRLKLLSLVTCPELTIIFTPGLLKNLNSLEELEVVDCPLVLSIVNCEDASVYASTYFLPKLRKLSLICLPQLISVFGGLHIAPNLAAINIADCPNLCPNLKRTSIEIVAAAEN